MSEENDDDVVAVATVDEDITARHRRERKELQAHVQSLKKACAKGDKKKKKELNELVAKLESELETRQNAEREQYDATDGMEDGSEEPEADTPSGKRMSKANRRRQKKAAEEKEREERINEQEARNRNGPRSKEIEQLSAALEQIGLRLYNVPADGNCLYCAVGHQLEVTGRRSHSIDQLRKMTADYMLRHRDDLMPFMTHPDRDDIFTHEEFDKYCKTLVTKPVWGGQIEIRALSNALTCPIKVIQADSQPTVQGEQFEGPPLVIAYHRHLYRLGEHYNSTISINDE